MRENWKIRTQQGGQVGGKDGRKKGTKKRVKCGEEVKDVLKE